MKFLRGLFFHMFGGAVIGLILGLIPFLIYIGYTYISGETVHRKALLKEDWRVAKMPIQPVINLATREEINNPLSHWDRYRVFRTVPEGEPAYVVWDENNLFDWNITFYLREI